MKPVIEPTGSDLAYAAGLFDGEGTVTISSRLNGYGARYHSVNVGLSNLDPRPIRWLRDRFGGSIQVYARSTKYRPVWRWSVTAISAHRFIVAVRPYLIIKADQADIAIAFRETIRRFGRSGRSTIDPVTDELSERRELLRRQITDLKHVTVE